MNTKRLVRVESGSALIDEKIKEPRRIPKPFACGSVKKLTTPIAYAQGFHEKAGFCQVKNL